MIANRAKNGKDCKDYCNGDDINAAPKQYYGRKDRKKRAHKDEITIHFQPTARSVILQLYPTWRHSTSSEDEALQIPLRVTQPIFGSANQVAKFGRQ